MRETGCVKWELILLRRTVFTVLFYLVTPEKVPF
jgi:hypothetical protein